MRRGVSRDRRTTPKLRRKRSVTPFRSLVGRLQALDGAARAIMAYLVSAAGALSARQLAHVAVSAPPKGRRRGAVSMRAPVKENHLLNRLEATILPPFDPTSSRSRWFAGRCCIAHRTQIDQVYFPLNGMISILAVTKSGEQIETAIVGREGVVGASIGSFGPNAFGQATVQIAGEAVRIHSSAS